VSCPALTQGRAKIFKSALPCIRAGRGRAAGQQGRAGRGLRVLKI